MHKKSQVQKIYKEFSRIFKVQLQKQFQDSNIPNLTSLKLEASLGTKTK
jgi:hypothetical protein